MAQEEVAADALNDGTPVILYSGEAKKYVIADIAVEGADNYEDNIIINISGLQVGETIEVPGEDITDAAKRYWKHGLFSDVSIQADKIIGDRIWLRIKVSMRPRVSEVNYHGLKKSEQEDLQARIGMRLNGGNITAKGLEYINALRSRANAKTVDQATCTLDYILDERSRELYYEGFRRTDLIRYGYFGGDKSGDYLWEWKGGVQNGQAFAAFRNIYAIPAEDINANPKLKQNPNY